MDGDGQAVRSRRGGRGHLSLRDTSSTTAGPVRGYSNTCFPNAEVTESSEGNPAEGERNGIVLGSLAALLEVAGGDSGLGGLPLLESFAGRGTQRGCGRGLFLPEASVVLEWDP